MKSAVAAAATTVRRARAAQQPEWTDLAQVQRVRAILAGMPPLVRLEDVRMLRSLLAHVAAGRAPPIPGGGRAAKPPRHTPPPPGYPGAAPPPAVGPPTVATPAPLRPR